MKISNYKVMLVKERIWLQREIRKIKSFHSIDKDRLKWLYNQLQVSYKFH